MNNLQKIAVLIDADNTQIGKIESVICEISTRGRIVVKRAYGNWRKDNLKNWEIKLKRSAIKAVQQFDYVTGKNATDMALVIDALDLLYSGIYDAFVIVASDSDYTPLAIKLHESGVYVMGIGNKTAKDAFKNACDEFILLENLASGFREESIESDVADIEKSIESDTDSNNSSSDTDVDSIDEVHELLRIAFNTYQNDEGLAYVSSAGAFIKRAKPDFDLRTYGFHKLTDLLMAYADKYKVIIEKREGRPPVVSYNCLEN